jgi:O-methyltransferase
VDQCCRRVFWRSKSSLLSRPSRLETASGKPLFTQGLLAALTALLKPGWANHIMRLVERVIERRLTYLKPEKLSFLMNTIERLNAEGVRGDLAEFGIALGGSAICIASMLTAGQKFYGFDNFELIPSPEPIDGERANGRYRAISSGESSGIGGDRYYGYEHDRLSLVIRNFEEFGIAVDNERVLLIKGLFEETLPRSLKGPFAFAHIDCDWYSPVRLCLERLYPLLAEGGAIVIDDYNNWEGCTKATNEFCAGRSTVTLTPARNSAVLVKRPA